MLMRMDFMKWLNSLGELLYEVMSWLIFYPITLWRTVTRPLQMMGYSNRELTDQADEQFTDTLNPPLFLVLSLLLTQELDKALGGGTNPIIRKNTGLAGMINDDTTLLVLRLVLFSLFPLMMAARFLRAKGVKVTRNGLRAPFYAQCYACAPFALTLGIGLSLQHLRGETEQAIGAVLALGSMVAYLGTETIWFARGLQQGVVRAAGHALLAFVAAAVIALALGALIVTR